MSLANKQDAVVTCEVIEGTHHPPAHQNAPIVMKRNATTAMTVTAGHRR